MRKTGLSVVFLCILLAFSACTQTAVSDPPSAADEPPAEPAEAEEPKIAERDVFCEKDIFSPALYRKGLKISSQDGLETGADGCRTAVLPLSFGCVYNVRFPEKPSSLRVAVTDSEPTAAAGLVMLRSNDPGQNDLSDLIYVPQREGEYLLIYTGDDGSEPTLFLGESRVVAEGDTAGEWWTAPPCGSVDGLKGSWADFRWSGEQMSIRLFDELCFRDFDRIQCEQLGMDTTGNIPMLSYVFTPENYEKTLILVSGMHGTDADAALALYKFLEIMENEDGSFDALHYLHTKVRLVVVPVINVWGFANGHDFRNSTGSDLALDYEERWDAETKNICALLEKYSDAAAVIDFRCHTKWDTTADLYYSAPLCGDRTAAFFGAVNHIYHRLKSRGLAAGTPDLSHIRYDDPLSAKTLSGRAFKKYGIPCFTVWHSIDNYFKPHSADGITLAVENFGNIILSQAVID